MLVSPKVLTAGVISTKRKVMSIHSHFVGVDGVYFVQMLSTSFRRSLSQEFYLDETGYEVQISTTALHYNLISGK